MTYILAHAYALQFNIWTEVVVKLFGKISFSSFVSFVAQRTTDRKPAAARWIFIFFLTLPAHKTSNNINVICVYLKSNTQINVRLVRPDGQNEERKNWKKGDEDEENKEEKNIKRNQIYTYLTQKRPPKLIAPERQKRWQNVAYYLN